MRENWFRSPLQPSAHEWTIEQVEEAATWLIERTPTGVANPWQWAAEHAIPYLDARRDACLAAMAKGSQFAAEYSEIMKDAAAQNEAARTTLPFKKAVKKIVGETRWDRALRRFKKFLRLRPRMLELYLEVVPTGGQGEFIAAERTTENLEAYVQKYLVEHSKAEMAGDEIALLRGWFLKVEGEIQSETQRENANKRKKR